MKTIPRFASSILCSLLLLGSLALAGCAKEDEGEKVYWEPVYSSNVVVDPVDTNLIPIVAGRTSWNIVIQFGRKDETQLCFYIKDYDNLGFEYYTCMRRVEMLTKNGWKIIRDYPTVEDIENSYVPESFYCPGRIDKGYASGITFVDDSDLKKGHYRVTQKIYDKEFSCEFDIL